MEAYESLWETMEANGRQWAPMGLIGAYDGVWERMGTDGSLWETMRTYGAHGAYGGLRKLMAACGE